MNKRTFREGDLVYVDNINKVYKLVNSKLIKSKILNLLVEKKNVQKTYWFISTLDNISVDFINEDRLTLVEKGTKVAINTGIV